MSTEAASEDVEMKPVELEPVELPAAEAPRPLKEEEKSVEEEATEEEKAALESAIKTSQPGKESAAALADEEITPAEPAEWNDSLFDCFADPKLCCYGLFCPWCLFGHTMQAGLDEKCCPNCCLYFVLTAAFNVGCFFHCYKRGTFREQHGNLPAECCQVGCCSKNDFCASCCCAPCSICQMARHTKMTHPDKIDCCGM